MVESRNGGQVLIEALEAHGVDTAFGIPGVHNLAVYEALRNTNRIKHVLVRHEQGAGFMADGYARVSGKPGVCFVISGPGLTNILTPLAGAFAESAAVLVIATALDSTEAGSYTGALHEIKDQFTLGQQAAGWSRRVTDPDDIPAAVEAAMRALTDERPRGAYLELSLGAINGLTNVTIPAPKKPQERLPSTDQVSRVVELLKASRKPLILAGSGVVAARAASELRQLAEALGAPVVLGPKSNDLLPSAHPLRFVTPRFHQDPDVEAMIGEADVVLAIGTKLGQERGSRGDHTFGGVLVRVDIDAEEMTHRYPAEVQVHADARAFLTQLNTRVAASNEAQEPWYVLESLRDAQSRRLEVKHGDRLAYLDAVRAALPDDGILVADMTMLGYASSEYFEARQPYRFLHPYQYCSIGHGFPMAIGARVASGTDPVVVLCGDGGVLQTITEMVSAVESEIPIITVVFNDQTYSAVKAAQVKTNPDAAMATDLVAPNFVQLGEAMGAKSILASSPEELTNAIKAALQESGPTLIEVPLISYP